MSALEASQCYKVGNGLISEEVNPFLSEKL